MVTKLLLLTLFANLTFAELDNSYASPDMPVCRKHEHLRHEYLTQDCQNNKQSGMKALFYYDESCVVVDGITEPLPQETMTIPCNKHCLNGEILDIDIDKWQSTCKKCPENTYSLGGNGFMIDGRMGDWLNKNYMAKNFEMYCQVSNDDEMFGRDQYCQPWTATHKSLKAQQGSMNNTVITYVLNIPVIFDSNDGYVEFEFRKDSIGDENVSYGVFEFLIDGVSVFFDKAPELYSQDWKVWNSLDYKLPISQGYHLLTWKYTKFNEIPMTQYLEAEISYIKIKGTKSKHQCTPCAFGISKSFSSRCQVCPSGTVYNDGVCEECPSGTYSFEGDLACHESYACTKSDYKVSFTDCVNGRRKVIAKLIEPVTCDLDHDYSFKYTGDEEVQCHPCGWGTAPNERGDCEYCPSGFYQDVDYHQSYSDKSIAPKSDEDSGKFVKKQECKVCEAGSYAQKVLELEDFENIPDQFLPVCVSMSPDTSYSNCNGHYRWRAEKGRLSSGMGMLPGFRIGLQAAIHITAEHGGHMFINFFTRNLASHEYFGIYLDGTLFKKWGPGEANRVETVVLDLDHGMRMIEFSAVSDRDVIEDEEIGIESHGSIYIDSIMVFGMSSGGGIDCLKCPEGRISKEGSSFCTRCPPGTQPNESQTHCDRCPEGSFKHGTGEHLCEECPALTTTTIQRTSCLPYDKLTNAGGQSYDLFRLKTNNICTDDGHYGGCENGMMGPIRRTQNKIESQKEGARSTFYFANNQEFDPTSIQYTQPLNGNNKGYVFALLDNKNVTIDQIKLEVENIDPKLASEHLECLRDQVNLKYMRNLGSKQGNITIHQEDGYIIEYVEGDQCNESGKRFESAVSYVCELDESKQQTMPSFAYVKDCVYHFAWHTKEACPVCREDQVELVKGPCNTDGYRGIARRTLEGQKCFIPETKKEKESFQIKDHKQYTSYVDHQYKDSVSLAQHSSEIVSCSVQDDINDRPVLQLLGKILGLALLFLICCLSWACYSYRSLQNEYEEVSQRATGINDETVIVNQDADNEEVSRPKRRNIGGGDQESEDNGQNESVDM